jgi:hypothetical protein
MALAETQPDETPVPAPAAPPPPVAEPAPAPETAEPPPPEPMPEPVIEDAPIVGPAEEPVFEEVPVEQPPVKETAAEALPADEPAFEEPAPEDDHSRARDGVSAGELMPLEQILEGIAMQFDGHQLGVDGPQPLGGGRYGYAVKWLTEDGSVLYIFVDAETGAIISVKGL